MHASTLIRDVEADAIVGPGERWMEEINACQPTVVMTDDGGALSVNEVRHFVPNPRLGHLDRSEGVRGDGQKPVEGFNQDKRQWYTAVAETQLAHFPPGHVPFRSC